jgi:hypothetical protein
MSVVDILLIVAASGFAALVIALGVVLAWRAWTRDGPGRLPGPRH